MTTSSRGRLITRILRRCGRIVAVVVAVIVALTVIGASLEGVLAAGDDSRYPARGQLVDVGGRQLHLHCVGEGSPTVVLDAGLGGFSLDWTLVQPELEATTRVCAYDRAGYGWSDPSSEPPTPLQAATDLRTLLVGAGIEGPYVLVGHSAGGKHVRLFASRHPREVVGMVLVDARHESVDRNRSPEALAAEHQQQRQFQRILWAAARVGLVRAFWARVWPKYWPTTANLTAETRAEIGVLQARTQQIEAVLREDALLTQDNALLSSAPSLRQMPLIVLAAGQNSAHDPLWLPAQVQQARLSTNAKLIVAKDSSHYIHWDQPTLVVQAIDQVVDAARMNRRLGP